MYKGIDHIVIVVRDIQQATKDFERILGVPPLSGIQEVKDQGYVQAKFPVGGVGAFINVAQPVSDKFQAGAAMKRSLERRGEGLHNIALAVDNVDQTMEEMKSRGEPIIPSAHSHSYFLHPKSMHGVLTQVLER